MAKVKQRPRNRKSLLIKVPFPIANNAENLMRNQSSFLTGNNKNEILCQFGSRAMQKFPALEVSNLCAFEVSPCPIRRPEFNFYRSARLAADHLALVDSANLFMEICPDKGKMLISAILFYFVQEIQGAFILVL